MPPTGWRSGCEPRNPTIAALAPPNAGRGARRREARRPVPPARPDPRQEPYACARTPRPSSASPQPANLCELSRRISPRVSDDGDESSCEHDHRPDVQADAGPVVQPASEIEQTDV